MADTFIGEIKMVSFDWAPRDWAFCDGKLLPIIQYQTLFSVIGTTYGGDGRTTFALPDLRGRVAVNMGSGPKLTPRPIGEQGGAEDVVLNKDQMPTHTHKAVAHASFVEGNAATPAENIWGTDSGGMSHNYNTGEADSTMRDGAVTNEDAGGDAAHTNMQPYLVLNFIIALTGILPTRP